MIRLQMLISTIGRQGILNLADSEIPFVEGIEWLVMWQRPSGCLPDSLIRPDIRVITDVARGVSRSRNRLIEIADADFVAFGDDDISYSTGGLIRLFNEMKKSADDIFFFRVEMKMNKKKYPDHARPFTHRPRGWWPSSVEIGARRQSLVDSALIFDEAFGLGSGGVCCGEEDIFLHEALRRGLACLFLPVSIGMHRGLSTGNKSISQDILEAKGAVYRHIYPYTWWLRILKFGPLSLTMALKGIDKVRASRNSHNADM